MNGLDFTLFKEKITCRRVEAFNKRHLFFIIGILELVPRLREKFIFFDRKNLSHLRHSLTRVKLLLLGGYDG